MQETGSKKNGVMFKLTQENEYVKQYVELDGQSRTFRLFIAGLNTEVGSPCAVTAYSYSSPTSTTIVGRIEGEAIWNQKMEDESNTLLDYTTFPLPT